MDLHSVKKQNEVALGDGKANLSQAKRALLELRLKKGAKPPKPDVISRRSANDHLPLSFAQELLWLLDRLNPNLSVYSVPRAMRIVGDLNAAALERTLDQIVERHEVLRTTYAIQEGEPVQIIGPVQPVGMRAVDLSQFPPAQRDAEVQRLLMEEARRPFDLSKDLMLRALLLRLAENEHILLLGTHHIASDGWSKSVLFKELASLYQSHQLGQASGLQELPIQYADFALWQRRHLQGPGLTRELTYWKQQLAGAPMLVDLPHDHPRPAVQSFRGAFFRQFFPKSILEGIRALGQQEDATLFMTLLAAFNVLLFRLTGQDDLIVGTPIAGRNRPETEGLVGYFTNTLALRTRLGGNPTFRQLLGKVRDMALEAYDHQELPFEKLVIEFKPNRDLSHSPVFQVLFSVGHAGVAVPNLPGLTLSPVVIDRGITKFDLTFGLTELPDALACGTEYSTDLFEPETPARFVDSFRVLLEGIIANPDCRIADLPLLTHHEKERIVKSWNDTQAPLPPYPVVHRLIEEQVARNPKAIAVEFAGQQLTYQELNDRANQLAHYLMKRGVGPEVLVGICLERSLELAVGLLGILKAGGAYLPLDPSYPKDRLAFMIEDAKVPVLLTQRHLQERLPKSQATLVNLDTEWPQIARENTANLHGAATPDQAAYVIYTSGSTGRPRGVVVSHRNLVNHNLAAIQVYGFSSRDRVLQFASMSFDIAVEEIFPSWVVGAAVVFRPPDMPMSGSSWVGWLSKNCISVLDLPTAFWHEWVHDLSTRSEPIPKSLRLVIVGGEKALPAAYAAWRQAVGEQVQWVNTYGPTEGTVIATVFDPLAQGHDLKAELPIGRPVANARVYVLDKYLQPVPAGVAGELYLGGLLVARGYLGRPGLTAEKFVPDPFSEEGGARLYRTGDRVRFRKDGNLEYLGRADHQVKIRGFRIEPGEIEAELSRHPGVREAAVIDREDKPGHKQLVAYIVESGSETNHLEKPLKGKGTGARLKVNYREFLSEKLPDYMVPSSFVSLAELPKTPNGKVDRSALPAPGEAGEEMRRGLMPPRDSIELKLVMLWENLLNVNPIGVQDNFFELGGHSLLAVRLFAQVAQVFGRQLPLALLFQSPTIAKLAEVLRNDPDTSIREAVIPIQPGGTQPPFFCVAAPNVNALGFVFLGRHLGSDQPTYGLQAQLRRKQGHIHSNEEYRALASDYIAAMRKVQPQGPYYFGGTCEGAHIAFEMARQLSEIKQEVGLLAMLDAWPLENTASYFLHVHVHYYVARFRGLRAGGLAGIKAFLRKKWQGFWRGWKKSPPTPAMGSEGVINDPIPTPPPQSKKDWKARLWPGKNFVPPQVPCRINVFRVAKQPYWRIKDELLGWGPWTRNGVDVWIIPGRHHTILREPNVQVLAKLLGESLRNAQKNGQHHDSMEVRKEILTST